MAALTPSQKNKRLESREKKRRETEKKLSAQLFGDIGALAIHGVVAVVQTKFPRTQSFDKKGNVRVRALAAPALYIGGLAMGEDAVAVGTRDLGLLMGGAELDRAISGAEWAQPGASMLPDDSP